MIYFAIANAPTTPSILYIVSDSLANVNSFTTCRATNPRVIALVHAAYNIAARKGITFIVDHCQSSSNYADDASRLWIKGPDVKDVYYRTDDMNHQRIIEHFVNPKVPFRHDLSTTVFNAL